MAEEEEKQRIFDWIDWDTKERTKESRCMSSVRAPRGRLREEVEEKVDILNPTMNIQGKGAAMASINLKTRSATERQVVTEAPISIRNSTLEIK